ncbi:flippase-like domain-containing protein [Bacteroidia bacterium]|nr:flippase-like domain-containing protein [Bacteroidia bacterium]MDB4174401.1 flippase-like domain-containing protein [Bacteroidia bacterium]
MTKNTKTAIQTIVFLVLGGLLFYWAVGSQDLSKVWENIKDADKKWIIVSMICGILSHLARALRWNLLLEPMGYKATTAGSFHAVILGYLVNMGLPRVGEITRPAVLSKLEDIPLNKLVGTVVVERVVDLLITLLIAIAIFFLQFDMILDTVASLFKGTDVGSFQLYGLIIAVVLTIGILIYRKREWFYTLPIIGKFKSFIEGLLDGVKTIFNLKRKGLFIFYSSFIWVMYFFMPFFIFYAFSGTSHLGFGAGLTVLLFGTAAMIVPIPGGVGTFEVMVPKALAIYGIAKKSDLATSYVLVTHAIQSIVIIGVGIVSIIYFVLKSRKLKKDVAKHNN